MRGAELAAEVSGCRVFKLSDTQAVLRRFLVAQDWATLPSLGEDLEGRDSCIFGIRSCGSSDGDPKACPEQTPLELAPAIMVRG